LERKTVVMPSACRLRWSIGWSSKPIA